MKKMILGLVIGLTFGLATNAFAAIGDKVQAVFAEFNYVVNGNNKTLEAPVLVYEGTSYVRTTQIANLLGFDVTYKADSRTIEFNNLEEMPVTPVAPTPIPTTTPDPDEVLTSLPDNTADPTNGPTASPALSPTPSPTVTPKPRRVLTEAEIIECAKLQKVAPDSLSYLARCVNP